MTARNEALDATPELVNSDPYGEGWIFEIERRDAGRTWTDCSTPRPTATQIG